MRDELYLKVLERWLNIPTEVMMYSAHMSVSESLIAYPEEKREYIQNILNKLDEHGFRLNIKIQGVKDIVKGWFAIDKKIREIDKKISEITEEDMYPHHPLYMERMHIKHDRLMGNNYES